MIQANELRIGDWVIFSEDGTKFIVEEVSRTGLGVTNQNETTWIEIDQFEPIPLTEEILLKCGFEKIEHPEYLYKLTYKGMAYVGHEMDELFVFLNGAGDYSFYFNDLFLTAAKYLHQLQNLYWCLCGEELDIDL